MMTLDLVLPKKWQLLYSALMIQLNCGSNKQVDIDNNIVSGTVNEFSLFALLEPRVTVGGELIPIDTTSLLLAGTYSNAAWMIPAIVSAIGIGIVIARKF